MAKKPYFERALFFIGDKETGKSTQLRSMFKDWRLGTRGRVPTQRKLTETYPLSNERWLYLRLTSPHEMEETLTDFLEKCTSKMIVDPPAFRWNFAGALQRTPTKFLGPAPNVIEGFIKRFAPERVRAVILCPLQTGEILPDIEMSSLTKDLQRIPNLEIMTVDATQRERSGLMYSDFFNFT